MANDELPHLVLRRSESNVERRKRPGFAERPDNPAGIGQRLGGQLATFRASQPEPAFDERRLVQVKLRGDPAALEQALPGVRVVAQEGDSFTILLAADEHLDDLQRRLEKIGAGERATYDGTLLRIEEVRGRTRDDRIGPALREVLDTMNAPFVVDVELWPHDEDVRDRESAVAWIEEKCREHEIAVLDKLVRNELVLVRVRATRAFVEVLAAAREVRVADLPPRLSVDRSIFVQSVRDLREIPRPPQGAPGVVVLDTGIATNHPLLAPAIGDAQSYAGQLPSADTHGHGTAVAGITLYDDVEAAAQTGAFLPRLTLHSGRVLDDNAEANDAEILENALTRAVRYFVEAYGCRVFVFAFGDTRHVYTGGRVGRIATVLDALAREHGILFVLPTGNLRGVSATAWRTAYPSYLEAPDAALLDPAPAVSALTVGSVARYTQSSLQANTPNAIVALPVAQAGQPSPFTRAGPGLAGAIKPEFVAHGGNYFEQHGQVNTEARDLAVVTTSYQFASQLYTRSLGTSFAAPAIAHRVARVLAEYENAGTDLARALLAANARIPAPASNLWNGRRTELRNVVGYGEPDLAAALSSTNRRVVLIAEDSITANQAHFYEVPLPGDFVAVPARRVREMRVALAFTPWTRPTRLAYVETPLDFRLVRGPNLAAVERAFRRRADGVETSNAIPEPQGVMPTTTERGASTLQAATWTIRQVDRHWAQSRPFVVVRRLEQPWSRHTQEALPYALVVVLDDATNEHARLHEQLSQRLRPRNRARGRVRT